MSVTSKDENTWVNLEQALLEIGVKTKGALYYYVGKTDGVRVKNANNDRDHLYNLADLRRLRNRRIARTSKKQRPIVEPEYVLEWLTPKDLGAVLDLDMQVFQSSMIGNYRLYQSWIEKNNHIALCAFENKASGDNRRKCFAYISALPLKETTILSVMRGERDELDITQDDIEIYERDGAYTLLVNSVVSSHEKYLSLVFHAVLNYWIAQYPKKYISKIYAQAASPSGRMLIQKLRLGPIYMMEGDTPKALDDAYMLDLSVPAASPILRRFQESLKMKR